MNGELVRFAYFPNRTVGFLTFGAITLATIEEPWIADCDGPGGQRRESGKPESCIPDGTYHLRPWNSAKFPNTYSLVNDALGVYAQNALIPPGQRWGRSEILIHTGNTLSDTLGCILVGLHHAQEHSAVMSSRIAMDRLRAVLGKDTHSLTIRPKGTA